MNKRGAGVVFCGIAAFLFAVRYITAAIFMSGVSSWSDHLFSTGLTGRRAADRQHREPAGRHCLSRMGRNRSPQTALIATASLF